MNLYVQIIIFVIVAILKMSILDASEVVDLGVIVKQWKSREAKVQIVYFEMESIEAPSGKSGNMVVHPNIIVSFDDLRIKQSYQMHGENQRRTNYMSNYSKGQSRNLTVPHEVTDKYYPIATLHDGDVYDDIENLHLYAILLCFRPFNQKFLAIDETGFILSKESAILDGKKMVVVILKSRIIDDELKYEQIFWLDPEMDYTVRRYYKCLQGELTFQLDINYKKNEKNLIYPNQWQFASLNSDGGVDKLVKCTVSKAMVNKLPEGHSFDLDFPVGTWVFEQKTNEMYLTMQNGKKRTILPEETAIGITYRQLLSSRPGDHTIFGKKQFRTTYQLILTVINVAVFVMIVIFFVCRRLKSRNP